MRTLPCGALDDGVTERGMQGLCSKTEKTYHFIGLD